MAKKLIFPFTIFLFYLSENVYGRIGLSMPYYNYLIVLFFFGMILFLSIKKVCHKQFIYYVIFALIYVTLRTLLMGTEGLYWLNLLLFGAPILGYFFYTIYSVTEYVDLRKRISRSIFILYIIECVIAIFERIIGSYVFGWVTKDDGIIMSLGDANEFRSTAMFGHPLQNALVVSTLMAFILFSEIKTKTKLWLWFLGYISIMCFNTRSSMVGDAMMLGLFLFSKVLSSKGKGKIKYFMLLLLISATLLYLLFRTSLGGRLVEMGLVDDTSAQVRINTWSIFDYFSLSNFLWGHSTKEAADFSYSAGLIATENFWIDWMFLYGLVTILIYVVLMFHLLKSLYVDYKRIAILGTCCNFWLLASTNNSLSTSFIPLLVFILCIIIFSPKNEKYLYQSVVK